MKLPLLLTSVLALTACATTPVIQGLPPAQIMARGETMPVGTAKADAADDPAIWHNAANPAQSLIIATDKKAGLYVYGLDGAIKSFVDAGLVNNVDNLGDLVVASDRNDPLVAHLATFRLDPVTGKLAPLGRVMVGPGEAYGVCFDPMMMTGGVPSYSLALVLKDGTVIVGNLSLDAQGKAAAFTRTWEHKLPTQSEGCVFHQGTLYVGEEDAGIWAMQPRNGGAAPVMIAPIDNQRLVADVEGLAIVEDGASTYLLASSQGDNAYAVWRLNAATPGVIPSLDYKGRFAIVAGTLGPAGTSETDGIAAMAGDFGPAYPGGLFIAQDGDNRPAAQNFKLVSWADIKGELGL